VFHTPAHHFQHELGNNYSYYQYYCRRNQRRQISYKSVYHLIEKRFSFFYLLLRILKRIGRRTDRL